MHGWIGPPAKWIPQPKPDIDTIGHYLSAFQTPLVDSDGKPRKVYD